MAYGFELNLWKDGDGETRLFRISICQLNGSGQFKRPATIQIVCNFSKTLGNPLCRQGIGTLADEVITTHPKQEFKTKSVWSTNPARCSTLHRQTPWSIFNRYGWSIFDRRQHATGCAPATSCSASTAPPSSSPAPRQPAGSRRSRHRPPCHGTAPHGSHGHIRRRSLQTGAW